MKTAKRFAVLLLTLNLLFLTGCWNYREVDNMSMVSGFAIDKGREGFKYHATFEFLDLSNGKTGSKLLETEGDTLFDCTRNAMGKTKKKLMFSHCKIVVINNEIATEGISSLFDWLLRDHEIRIDLNPIISKKKTAAEILQQKPITDQLISLEISDMLKQSSAYLGETPDVELFQANDILSEEGHSLILPLVDATKEKEKTAELAGTAVFKKDKLVGYLNRSESKFFLFCTNKIKGGLLITSPKNDNNNITLEILESRTKITPVISNNDITMNIEIKLKATLGEDQTPQNYISADGIKEVEKSAVKTLEYGVNDVIKKVQNQYGSDIFGFGSTIHQNNPEFWSKEKSNWAETFRTLKYAISAEVAITNTATAKKKGESGE